MPCHKDHCDQRGHYFPGRDQEVWTACLLSDDEEWLCEVRVSDIQVDDRSFLNRQGFRARLDPTLGVDPSVLLDRGTHIIPTEKFRIFVLFDQC